MTNEQKEVIKQVEQLLKDNKLTLQVYPRYEIIVQEEKNEKENK